MMVTDLIGTKSDLLWWQMSLRAVLILIFGLVLLRLLGRRAYSQQNPLDIIVAIVIGSTLARALTGNAPFFATLAAMAVLMLVFWLLDHAAARWLWLGRLAKGDPVPLARDHRFDRKRLALWGITEGDIAEAARSRGMPGVDAVKDAVLERNGRISTIGDG